MSQHPQQRLRWNHPALDAICRSLPDFGSCVLVAQDDADFSTIWREASRGLVPNGAISGLRTLQARWEDQSPSQLADRIRDAAVDLLILSSDMSNLVQLRGICASVSRFPCALIVLLRAKPPKWSESFEVMLEFGGNKAKIWHAGDSLPAAELACELRVQRLHVEAPELIAAKSSFRILTCGMESVERKHLSGELGSALMELKSDPAALLKTLPCELLLVCAPLSDETAAEAIRRQVEAGSPWIAMGDGALRDEDRPALYLAGATTILSKTASLAETVSAVRANLPGYSPKVQRSSAWGVELDQLLSRVARIRAWTAGDSESASRMYGAIIDHQRLRAKDTATELGAFLIELPELPAQVASASGWTRLFREAMLNLLTSAVRTRDLCFLVDRTLVVLSPGMSQMAARAIARRVAELVPETGGAGTSPRDIVVDTDVGITSAAYLQKVFDAASGRRLQANKRSSKKGAQ